jgi:AmmeMemoRadiSam system protein B
MLRNPVVSGSFYPSDVITLKQTMKKYFDKIKTKEKKSVSAIVPHAGYVYSGQTAAYAYSTIKEEKTFVILCPNHTGNGASVSVMNKGVWNTPLGNLLIDDDLAKDIIDSSAVFTADERAHTYEHSCEVQLPFLQYKFGNFKFVPICISADHSDIEHCSEIGKSLAKVIDFKKHYVIVSSDLTHYGKSYGFHPFQGKREEVLFQFKKLDTQIINRILGFNSSGLNHFMEETGATVCGIGPILSLLTMLSEKGVKNSELLNYSTSYDVSKDISTIVGYSSMIFW